MPVRLPQKERTQYAHQDNHEITCPQHTCQGEWGNDEVLYIVSPRTAVHGAHRMRKPKGEQQYHKRLQLVRADEQSVRHTTRHKRKTYQTREYQQGLVAPIYE